VNDKHSELVGYVMDNPYEAAREIEQLRAALQAYVNDAKSQPPGRRGSPFEVRLAAAEAALKFRK
jgi:hypothetical protein